MANVPLVSLSRLARDSRLIPLFLAGFLAGCATSEEFFRHRGLSSAVPAPCQVACTWRNNVAHVPDPARNGVPAPGVAGRVYLFGADMGHPMLGDGKVTIDLFDETNGKTIMQERWIFDAESLKRSAKKDFLGEGYTLFLPWSNYKPETTKIKLRTKYEPAKGTPLYTENAVTLSEENGVIRQGAPGLMQTGGRKR